ncbi:MAG TPA: zinc-ribbon domain-containing protein [Acetobacteraceae bacterium]
MRITCPNCAAAYDVPAERLAGGRTVRCARCGSGWVPPADESEPEPLPAPQAAAPEDAAPELHEAATSSLPEPEPPPLAPAATARGIRHRLLAVRLPVPVLLAWAGSMVLLGALVWAMLAWRLDMIRVWPPSERLYSALGLLRR